jgi:hypothetical protein
MVEVVSDGGISAWNAGRYKRERAGLYILKVEAQAGSIGVAKLREATVGTS